MRTSAREIRHATALICTQHIIELILLIIKVCTHNTTAMQRQNIQSIVTFSVTLTVTNTVYGSGKYLANLNVHKNYAQIKRLSYFSDNQETYFEETKKLTLSRVTAM